MATIQIGDKAVVLPERVRFTIGDRRRLRKDYGVKAHDLEDLTHFKERPDEAEQVLFTLVLFVAKKLDERVTEADLESLTQPEFETVAQALTPYIQALLAAEEGALDRPTSTSSTPSVSGTAGDLETSKG